MENLPNLPPRVTNAPPETGGSSSPNAPTPPKVTPPLALFLLVLILIVAAVGVFLARTGKLPWSLKKPLAPPAQTPSPEAGQGSVSLLPEQVKVWTLVGTISNFEQKGPGEARLEIKEESGQGGQAKTYQVAVKDATKVILAKRDKTSADIVLDRYVTLADFKSGMKVEVMAEEDFSNKTNIEKVVRLTILLGGGGE